MSQYLTWAQYVAGGGRVLPDEATADIWLTRASMRIDRLTFNRITGLDSLSPTQQSLISAACLEQAEFEFENQDVVDSAIDSYSINGVSMSFGSGFGVKVIGGCAVKRTVADYLEQTGLMCRSVAWRQR